MSRAPSADLHALGPAPLPSQVTDSSRCTLLLRFIPILPHLMSHQQTTDYLHAGGTGVTTDVPTGALNRSYKTSYNKDGNTVPYSLTAHLQTNCDDLHRLTVT
jgi:hypothetical protein